MKLNVGDKVKILECHKMPDLVGREAKVLGVADPEQVSYPIMVMLPEPLTLSINTPLGPGQMTMAGPFPFREDELELVGPAVGIPDEFKQAFDE